MLYYSNTTVKLQLSTGRIISKINQKKPPVFYSKGLLVADNIPCATFNLCFLNFFDVNNPSILFIFQSVRNFIFRNIKKKIHFSN